MKFEPRGYLPGVLVAVAVFALLLWTVSDSSQVSPSRAHVSFNRTPEYVSSQGELLFCATSHNQRLNREARFRSNIGSWSRTSRSSYQNSTISGGKVTYIPTKAGPACMFYRAPHVSRGEEPRAVLLELVVKGRVEQKIHATVWPR